MIHVYAVIGHRPNLPLSMVAKRGLHHKSGKRSYPYVKKSFKTVEFKSIQQFCLQLDIVSQQKQRKFEMPMRRSEATPVETRNQRLLCAFLYKEVITKMDTLQVICDVVAQGLDRQYCHHYQLEHLLGYIFPKMDGPLLAVKMVFN